MWQPGGSSQGKLYSVLARKPEKTIFSVGLTPSPHIKLPEELQAMERELDSCINGEGRSDAPHSASHQSPWLQRMALVLDVST